MKKVLIVAVLISSFWTGFSQNKTLDICGKNKKTGWILLGSGIAVATTGFLITEIDGNGDQSILSENFDVGAWTFFAGIASCAGSIPFFISAHNACKKNRRTSAQINYINTNSFITAVPKRIPSFSIKIKLQ